MAYLQKQTKENVLILFTIYYWSVQEDKSKHVTQDRKQEESNSRSSDAKYVPRNAKHKMTFGGGKKYFLVK